MNEDSKKPIVWMVLFGISRHLLGIAGAWLLSRGLIDADTHQRLVSEGATQLVGWTLMLAPIVWSVLQKWQVWGWVRTALKLNEKNNVASDVPVIAAGPNVPI